MVNLFKSTSEPAEQIPNERRATGKTADAQQGRCNEGNTTYRVLLVCRRRNHIAILHCRQQTNELAEAKKHRASTKLEIITQMAIKKINHHIIYGTYRERYACTYKPESIVTQPE